MHDPEPPTEFDRDLDRLVRGQLERDSERIDPRPMFERIQADLFGASSVKGPLIARRRTARFLGKWVGIAATVALVAAGLTLFWKDRTALAKGETVIREARQAHLMPIDRCYLVEVRRDSSMVSELTPNTPLVRVTRLWTRGDRFWVESVRPDQRWAWGRDESNRFWIAFGPHTALRMDADEVPDWLNLYCDLHSLNVEQLLGDVLSKFDLNRETGSNASTIKITASARVVLPQFPSVQTIELEIDAETRVIRRMVVRRVWKDQPFATVTYTLAETDGLDPADYQVAGHLSDPSVIYTRDHEPQRRKELLARWFGSRPGRGLPPLGPKK